ncbi:MAG: TonB family protein [Bacteroidetes bacterium]|nr:TonB family protein [Bacteroidota bacterium]
MILLLLTISTLAFAQRTRAKQPKDTTRFIRKEEYIDVQILPKLLAPIIPIYPKRAAERRLKGWVSASVLIDTDGTVTQCAADYVSDPLFREPALKAAKNARFSPAIQNGKPVKIWWTLPIYFPPAVDSSTSNTRHYGRQVVARIADELIPSTAVRVRLFQPQYEPTLLDSFQHYIYYPEQAKREGREGTVVIGVLLDRSGAKKSINVLSATDSLFIRPALDAVGRARYAPFGTNSTADTATAYATVDFTIGHALDRVTLDEFPLSPSIRSSDQYSTNPQMRFDLEDLLVYPPEAKEQHLQGAVNVSAEINERGIVLQTVVGDSTNPIFNTAAQTAVEHMLFEPARNASGPIKTWWTVPVVFRLPHDTH